ncbi:MAG: secretin N-terminal domain-containing protein, partial [Pirellulaceae bacterium]
KLNQLRLRRDGMSTLNRPDMVRMLELTEAQKREIERLMDASAADMTRGGEATSSSATALEQPQLRTHPVQTADSAEALAVLQTLLAGLPDVRMSLDPNTNKIIALARPSEHKTIEETIRQLEGEAPRLEVIQLKRIDPQMAVVAIDNFFSNESEDEPSTIKIDADPSTMRLYVRATPSEIEHIKDLIDQLESPAAGSVGGTLRFIPLGNRVAAESAVETARGMWLGPNRIELLTPSDSGSSIFDLKEVNPEPADAPRFQSPRGGSGPRATPSRRLSEPDEEDPDVEHRDKVTFQRSDRRINGVPVQLVSLNEQQETSRSQEQSPEAPVKALDAELRKGPVNEPGPMHQQSNAPAEFERNEPTENAESGGEERGETADTQDSKEASSSSNTASDAGEEADIRIKLTPEGVLIASEDTEALDRFESLLRQLTGPQKITAERDFTVYFLKYARAEVAQQLISDILGGSTSGATSFTGDMASSLLGGGGGILGTLLGGGGGGGDEEGNAVTTIQAAGPVSMVADARLNCLVVQAMPADLELIEQLLKVVDREGSITDVQTAGKPHIIPIIYLNAEDVASVVKEAYADRIAQAGGGNQRGGRPDPGELIRALRGGRGGDRGGGRNGGNSGASEAPKMNIAVDAASNSLIVTAPEPLFKEVEELVYQIDQASSELTEDVVVVSLKSANPEAVQQALASVMNASSSRSASGGNASNRAGSNARNSGGGGAPGDMRARIEAFRRMREAMGRGGGRPGGGGPGGGGPQSRRGGGRPGGGRGR